MELKKVKTAKAGRLIRTVPISMGRLIRTASLLLTATAALSSCVNDDRTSMAEDSIGVEMLIRTHSSKSGDTGYETGCVWENNIDITGGDYRIYFFTNDRDDASAKSDDERNTLIAEFIPNDIAAYENDDYTQYTLLGRVGEKIADYPDFKVVVLANWGQYPTVKIGKTTIDALVVGDGATFQAEKLFGGVDSGHLIPFFGIREYSHVTWKKGWLTILTDDITLLRAVAKVEVIMEEGSGIAKFESVSIVRYNDLGYCAPARVYLRNDYDHDYTWTDDFTEGPHLVGGRNDTSVKTASFTHQTEAHTDKWSIYLPEYDNKSGDDYAFIKVIADGIDHEIYFADYMDGITSSTADYNILRNCLYRFYVTVSGDGKEMTDITVRTHVDKWEACFDSEYVFDRRKGRRR